MSDHFERENDETEETFGTAGTDEALKTPLEERQELLAHHVRLVARKVRYAREAGIDWRPLVRSQLSTLGRRVEVTKRLDNRGRDLRELEQAIRRHPNSVAEQQTAWCRATGKSRASFYRTLSRLRVERGG